MGAQAVRLSNIDIDNALKNKDFEVLFQPVFDLSSGVFSRVEAFVRWRHRQLGVLPPGAFISYFESQGRMGELTRYVLDRTLSDYLAWRGPQGPGFSINLALSDLADEAFSSHLTVTLRDRGIQPGLITLECPMPPVTMPVEQAAAHFARLSETGVRLAIEVRGRANDFLKEIDPFPFDEIKTGGAAILRFARTVRGPGLSAISELLEIAKAARSTIVAVGVEDQASLSALRSLGFSAAQGNHLAPVGTLDELPVAKINDVRTLLGLPSLSGAQIAAIAHPIPADAPARRPRTAAAEPETPGATVERLAQRISRQPAPASPETDSREPSRDRIKAALAAGRDRAALTKAAAIAKAKRKGETATTAGRGIQADENDDRPTADRDGGDHGEIESAETSAPARQLYDRLAEAFDASERRADVARPAHAPHDDVSVDRRHVDDAMTPFEPRQEASPPPSPAPRANPFSLSIGAARAYFRAGVHVSADAWRQADTADPRDVTGDLFEFVAGPPARAASVGDAGGVSTAPRAPSAAPAGPAPTAIVAPLRDPPAVLPAPAADSGVEELLIDLDTDERAEVAAAPTADLAAPAPRLRRPRKTRHYLSLPFGRVYLPPRHFWPKSWKRWWSARRASGAAA